MEFYHFVQKWTKKYYCFVSTSFVWLWSHLHLQAWYLTLKSCSNQKLFLARNRLGWLLVVPPTFFQGAHHRLRKKPENGAALAQSPLDSKSRRRTSKTHSLHCSSTSSRNELPRTSEAGTEKSWGFWQPRWVWDSREAEWERELETSLESHAEIQGRGIFIDWLLFQPDHLLYSLDYDGYIWDRFGQIDLIWDSIVLRSKNQSSTLTKTL